MSQLSALSLNPDGLALDTSTGHMFLVNGTGLVILRALQAGLDPVDILRHLTERYACSRRDVEKDLLDFQQRLRTLRLS